jgi:transcriptional regulator with XRE-family HTH domain
MFKKRLHTLKTARRRAGLTQADVALLLGAVEGSKVSRYERCRRLPPLRTALAYEAIFGEPVATLFAATYAEVAAEIRQRAKRLMSASRQERHAARASRKKQSINSLLSR